MKNGSITSPCLKSSSLKSSINWEISCRSCQRFWGKQAVRSSHPGHSGWPTFSHWMFGCENGSIKKSKRSFSFDMCFLVAFVCLYELCRKLYPLTTRALPYFALMCFNLRPDRQEDWEILFRIFTPSGGASTGPPSGRDPELRHCAKTDFKAAKEKAQTYKLVGGFVSFHCLSTNINCNQLEN